MTAIKATLIEGDGIGPEVMESALTVLKATGIDFEWEPMPAGMAAVNKGLDPLPEETMASIRRNRLVLKGPLTTPVGTGFQSANVRLRQAFSLYANVRPAVTMLPDGRFENIDLVLVRENTEGLYVGVEHFVPIDGDPHAVAEASGIITRSGCRRISEFTFRYALEHKRRKVTIVHKANILKALTGLFLETAREVGEKYRDHLEIEDRIVDNCAMQLVLNPERFDVIVTTNMFGDILSEEIAGLVGGLGFAASGNIGTDVALFEAIHGSAPDIAGQGIANPCGLLLSSAMMLDHIGHQEAASRIRQAIQDSLHSGVRTVDTGGTAGTKDVTAAVLERL